MYKYSIFQNKRRNISRDLSMCWYFLTECIIKIRRLRASLPGFPANIIMCTSKAGDKQYQQPPNFMILLSWLLKLKQMNKRIKK